MSNNETMLPDNIGKSKLNTYLEKHIPLWMGLLVIILMSSFQLVGNDYWWHIRIGEWIVQHKAVPDTAIFSWMGEAEDWHWVAHEWLSEVILYLSHTYLGETGTLILYSCVFATIIAITWNYCRRNMPGNLLACVTFFSIMAMGLRGTASARPHILGYILFAVEMNIIMTMFDKGTSKTIWLIPAISVLWSNLHGGSAMLAYFIPCVAFVVGCFNFSWGRVECKRLPKKTLISLGIICVLSVAGILVNPVGLSTLLYPFSSIGDVATSYISEWKSPDIKATSILLMMFTPIIIGSIGVFITKKKVRLIDLCFWLGFVYLFLRSVRFGPMAGLMCAFTVLRYWPSFKEIDFPCKEKLKAKREERRKKREEAKRRFEEMEAAENACDEMTGNEPPVTAAETSGGGSGMVSDKTVVRVVSCLAAGILLFFSIVSGVSIVNDTETEYISIYLTEGIVEAVKADNPQRLYNTYNTGGELLYNEVQVLWDAREDPYTEADVLVEFFAIASMNGFDLIDEDKTKVENFEMLLDKYNFDGFCVEVTTPLAFYLQDHPEKYECKYIDDTFVYYALIEESETQND